LGSGERGSNDNRIGYYGPLTFLDNQSEFVTTFGEKPHMLPINPTSTGKNEVQMMLREYAEKCKFDIFLDACRDFYVEAKNDGFMTSFSTFIVASFMKFT
jgi:hypothetical protein